MHDVEAVIKRFKTDLHNAAGFIQEPKKLKEHVKELYEINTSVMTRYAYNLLYNVSDDTVRLQSSL